MSAGPTGGESKVQGRVGTPPPHRWGTRWGFSAAGASRDEAELLAAPNGGPAAVHAELRVDALRMGTDGAQPNHKLVGDPLAVELRGEQPEDIELPMAE